MENKLIVTIYNTYGKNDGEEMRDRFLINDDKEGRERVVDEIGWFDYMYPSEDNFINKGLYEVSFDKSGGDWDEPTGGYAILESKKSLLIDIEARYEGEVRAVEKLFNIGGE